MREIEILFGDEAKRPKKRARLARKAQRKHHRQERNALRKGNNHRNDERKIKKSWRPDFWNSPEFSGDGSGFGGLPAKPEPEKETGEEDIWDFWAQVQTTKKTTTTKRPTTTKRTTTHIPPWKTTKKPTTTPKTTTTTTTTPYSTIALPSPQVTLFIFIFMFTYIFKPISEVSPVKTGMAVALPTFMFLFALGVLGSLFLNKRKNQINPPKAGIGCGKQDVHDRNNPNYQNVIIFRLN